MDSLVKITSKTGKDLDITANPKPVIINPIHVTSVEISHVNEHGETVGIVNMIDGNKYFIQRNNEIDIFDPFLSRWGDLINVTKSEIL